MSERSSFVDRLSMQSEGECSDCIYRQLFEAHSSDEFTYEECLEIRNATGAGCGIAALGADTLGKVGIDAVIQLDRREE